MAKCEQHYWRPNDGTGKFLEYCEYCKEKFPCTGNTCGHLDCDEVRNKYIKKGPRCFRCKKPVSGPVRFLLHGSGTRLHPIHEMCIVGDEQVSEVHIYE